MRASRIFYYRVAHIFDARETFRLDALLCERHFLVGIIAFINSPHRLYGGMISAPDYVKHSFLFRLFVHANVASSILVSFSLRAPAMHAHHIKRVLLVHAATYDKNTS